MTQTNEDAVLIIGAGQAAGEFAFALRAGGHTGAITLVGDEPHPPYQRPPLSKAYLSGEMGLDRLHLRPEAAYETARIMFLPNTRATAIDRSAKTVATTAGTLPYQKLVLATGGRPRLLALPDERIARAPNLHYLRTAGHADSMREDFAAATRLVIIGGGYIGLEVAAVARKRGIDVTVIEAMSRVLQRVTAPELSAFYTEVHSQAGVNILVETALTGFEFDAAGRITAVLAGGNTIPADLVIAGIGLLPNIELAADAGLAIDNGIAVDEYGQTSDPDIFAIGDCASHPSAYAGRRIRLESVPNAIEQARSTAAFFAGEKKPYNAIPWFWSDQYDLKLQMVGLNQGFDQVVLRGAPATRSFMAFYLKDGVVIAVDSVSRLAEFMVAKRLVAAKAKPDPASLADETQPLKSLVPASAAA